MNTRTVVNRLLHGATVGVDELIALREVKLPQRTANSSGDLYGGSRLTRHRGRGVDFAEVRLYHAGDDVRSIDWRVTARKSRPHTKVYREERERPTLVVVDQSRSMYFGSRVRMKSVAAAECAALLAWHAVEAGDRVGGLVFDDVQEHVLKPYRSARAVVRLLNRICTSNVALRDAASTRAVQGRLMPVLDRLLHIAHNGHRIYLISDFRGYDAEHELRLKRVARHNSLVLVHISDPLERELPPPERYAVTDGVARSVVATADARARDRYRDAFARHVRALEDVCVATRSEFIGVSTNEAAVARLRDRLLR